MIDRCAERPARVNEWQFARSLIADVNGRLWAIAARSLSMIVLTMMNVRQVSVSGLAVS